MGRRVCKRQFEGHWWKWEGLGWSGTASSKSGFKQKPGKIQGQSKLLWQDGSCKDARMEGFGTFDGCRMVSGWSEAKESWR